VAEHPSGTFLPVKIKSYSTGCSDRNVPLLGSAGITNQRGRGRLKPIKKREREREREREK